MKRLISLLACVGTGLLVAAVGCGKPSDNGESKATSMPADYPATRRDNQVDEYHGVQVADPYRWLEADVRESSEVAAWVEAQGAFAREFLDAVPERPAIVRRLTELWDYERYSAPTQEGGRYFYMKNDGLQNQAVLYVADAYDAEGRVLVDPNEWSEDGTASLATLSVSDDGQLLAYARSEAGSDWSQIHVMEVDTGRLLPDVLRWVRYSGISWAKDGSGFYYSRYPEPPPGEEFQAVATHRMAYFHRLGTEQEADVLVYHRPDEPDWSFWVGPTDDGQFLILSISDGTDPQNQVHVRAVDDADAPWTELIGDFDNEFTFLGNDGRRFYFMTDFEAPRRRVVAMDIDRPGRANLAEVVPMAEGTLESASLLSGRIVAQYLEDVAPRVRVFDQSGASLGEVELPGYGSVSGFGGDQDDTETFFAFASYNRPPTIYRYDVVSRESQLVRQTETKFNSDDYVVEQVFYESNDGTRVPMTLAYRKDSRAGSSSTPTGPRPTLLYGYGGFNISILPYFSADYLTWMELGGVLAVANLRGGGEYGDEWHRAGKLANKQNVFDDYIAAAEWLIADGRTLPEQLAIMGGSNGGLLVGAVMTQRPELFGACIPVVGVMDMLRFHQFTAGQFWRTEYGSADDAEQFPVLLAYSPYHNIEPGVAYPPTMVMTADTDDRVVPMHSFKFAAALQRAQAGDAPILLRVEARAGHGRGTPTSKLIETAADRWAFLVKVMGMNVSLDH